MKIQKITDEAFKKYGKVLAQYDCAELIREMEHTPLPEDVIYVPSVEELEVLSVARDFQNSMQLFASYVATIYKNIQKNPPIRNWTGGQN